MMKKALMVLTALVICMAVGAAERVVHESDQAARPDLYEDAHAVFVEAL